MTRVLVTGGAGFIGSNLVAALLERGDEVRVLDNFSTGSRRNLATLGHDVEVVEGDLRSYERVHAAVVLKDGRTASPSELIAHCASRIAGFKKPRTLEIVERLPRNAAGKILRRALR